MAGGIGSRFWPMSTTKYPKQFHDVLGVGRTLIQQTFDRFKSICPPENVFVVTNRDYKAQVLEQLPELTENQVLCEPSRRNTAPCVAYASYKIGQLNPDARVIVAPADHLILNQAEFVRIINIALEQCVKTESLITLGIKPSRPDTGYGYIQFTDAKDAVDSCVKKVKTFTEKPDLDIAKQFLESGDFYWNSGIFIWTLRCIIDALEKYMPEMAELFASGSQHYNTDGEDEFINKLYQVCTNISIDYGVMEKAKNVNVVLSDIGWSDLGTWGSLYTHLEKDKNQNAVVGHNVMLYESKGNVVHMPSEKLVVIQGLTDYIVVESDDTLLICKKADEQKIKQFVNDIKVNKGEEFV
jgi:mannose-1-phosphate guanylyltransferase